MTELKLTKNNKNNADLILTPFNDGKEITESAIHKLIDSSEFKSLYVIESAIKNAIAELNDVLNTLEEGKTGRNISYQILERKNATVEFTILTDEMSATADITTAQGGEHLTAKDILDAAKVANIVKGFSKEDLIKLAHVASKAAPGTVVHREIATGKQGINGRNAKIINLVQSAQDRVLKPREKEDGSVDMRDLGDIICVKVGDPIAEKRPFTLGTPGYTVTGNVLSPEPGEDVDLTAGEGTEIDPKNSNILISKLIGMPKLIPNGMCVEEVYKTGKVDVTTGNVKFKGPVIIDGDVSEGMRVESDGDITIGGFAESCFLDAGGDITIMGGVIGRKQDVDNSKNQSPKMSASISAKGKIFAKYCQYAELTSASDIRIENQLMHSTVNLNGCLWLGKEDKANGKLIGGYINAGTSVHAGIIGAPAGSNTIIEFNKRMSDFNIKLDEIDALIKVESEKIDELRAGVAKIKKMPSSPENNKIISKLIALFQAHSKNMGKLIEDKKPIEEEITNYLSSINIEATEKLNHGVEISVGKINNRTQREYGPSKISVLDKEIFISPLVNT